MSGWRLGGQRLGVARYIEYMLKNWNSMLLPDDRVTIFVGEPFEPESLGLSDQFSAKLLRPRLTNALWENLFLRKHGQQLDVLFGPSYTLPLNYKGRTVVAIHSVDEAVKGHFGWSHKLHYEQKYKLSARRANAVVANSSSVKDRIERQYGVPADKIEVVWLGADDMFRPIDDEQMKKATREKFLGADRPYILFAGGLSARRNVPMLMRAFSNLKMRSNIPHCLLLVGPNRAGIPLAEMARELGIADSVVHTVGRFDSHSALVPIYNAADAYVLPSVSEGFSLTLAEALACGTPVITTNQAALGEIAHGFALTLDEPTEEGLTDALDRVLSDEDYRRRLGELGVERSRSLRWDLAARGTLDLLRKVANGKKG